MMPGDEDLIPIAELVYADSTPVVADEIRVIPIEELFYDDAGPHIVPRATPSGGASRHTPARGRELQDLLGTSIVQLGGVSGGTRRTPVPLPPPVPIETLLYRGRPALERALEIRLERLGGGTLSEELIEELLDLIALAAEE